MTIKSWIAPDIQSRHTPRQPANDRQPNRARSFLLLLTVTSSATFALASLLHLGVPVPLLADSLDEPYNLRGGIAEGIISIVLAAGALAIIWRVSWAWRAAVAVHAFAAFGVVNGMFAMARAPGPESDTNTLYHQVILGVLVGTLVLLVTGMGRRALRGGRR